MKVIENRCCGCASPAYPCLGSSCPLRNVEVYYCDKCGAELDKYDVQEEGNNHYCEDCYNEIMGVEDDE